jgi:hypothetical protein
MGLVPLFTDEETRQKRPPGQHGDKVAVYSQKESSLESNPDVHHLDLEPQPAELGDYKDCSLGSA